MKFSSKKNLVKSLKNVTVTSTRSTAADCVVLRRNSMKQRVDVIWDQPINLKTHTYFRSYRKTYHSHKGLLSSFNCEINSIDCYRWNTPFNNWRHRNVVRSTTSVTYNLLNTLQNNKSFKLLNIN